MGTLHALLERQLKRIGIAADSLPPTSEAWQELLERVSQAYRDGEKDRYLLERSLEISTKEMQDQIAERVKAEEALQKATEDLKTQNQRLVRVNELFRASVEQMTSAVNHGATQQELAESLRLMQFEFERLDQQSANGH